MYLFWKACRTTTDYHPPTLSIVVILLSGAPLGDLHAPVDRQDRIHYAMDSNQNGGCGSRLACAPVTPREWHPG